MVLPEKKKQKILERLEMGRKLLTPEMFGKSDF